MAYLTIERLVKNWQVNPAHEDSILYWKQIDESTRNTTLTKSEHGLPNQRIFGYPEILLARLLAAKIFFKLFAVGQSR